MGLTRVAIGRPVFMLMVISAMVILGLVSFSRLNAELYPNINTPVVTVLTTYPGAGPDDVEQLVTEPIEDAVAGVANVDVLSSSSSEGISQVTVTFTDAADMNTAATDVERRISAIRATLPADADDPSVLKLDPSQQPVLYVALSSDPALNAGQALGSDRLYQLADDTIKPRLETQSGVASVDITGGLQREVQVQVNPTRLRAYNLSLDQVSQALARENQGVPGGIVEQGRQQTTLRVYGLFQSAADLRALTVTSSSAGTVRLGDVATVVDAYKRVTTQTYLNGRPAVALTITKQSSANEIATVDAVREQIDQLNRELPSGAQLSVVTDTSIFTRNSLHGVQRSLIEAIVLTGVVLLLFLHTLRSTAIVLFAIPTSLISTFLVMTFLGFSLNIMSTMALVLVVGVLVDDSIVVLENIFRFLELGERPWSAALKGRSEIGLAAIAITLVDVVVFTPVAFMSGTVGSFFRQFGLVIVSATLLSLFVSFTLTPLLASRWLRTGRQAVGAGLWARLVQGFEAGFERLRGGYACALDWALRRRWLPPSVALVALILAFAMVPAGLIKAEFIPRSDNSLFSLTVELPPGSSLQATDGVLRAVEQRLATVPEVKYYLSTSGVGGSSSTGVAGQNARYGRVQVVLVDRKERQRGLSEIIEQVTRDTQTIPGATIRASTAGVAGSAQPVQVRITGSDPQTLQKLASQVEAALRATPNTRDVTNSAAAGNPETRLVPDRQRMADLGITTQQVALALRTAVEGTVPTKLRPQGQDQVDVRLIADEATRASVGDLASLPLTVVRDGAPVTVTLGQVTSQQQVAGPTSIDRRNRQEVVTVSASLVGNTPLSEVAQPLQRTIDQMRAAGAIPRGYTVQLGGQTEEQSKAFGSLGLALALSIILEYMLLAGLYESMILPFATMLALPLSIVGAFLAIALTHNTLNMLSLIGVVVLMGLVGKNGILLVDYTNTLRGQGLSRTEALRQAGATRLRPILMTTLALVFGMLPLAAKLEEGSEIYAGMASVIIGGMLSSTVLSLLVVPCMYTYFDDLQVAVRKLVAWRPFGRYDRPSKPTADANAGASLPPAVARGGRPSLPAAFVLTGVEGAEADSPRRPAPE